MPATNPSTAKSISNMGYVRLVDYFGRSNHAYEHRIIVETVIGSTLRIGECVHHVNGITSDNRSLELCVLQSQAEHIELHRKLIVLRSGGNPWTHRLCNACRDCKSLDSFYRRSSGAYTSTCRACQVQTSRSYKARIAAGGKRSKVLA